VGNPSDIELVLVQPPSRVLAAGSLVAAEFRTLFVTSSHSSVCLRTDCPAVQGGNLGQVIMSIFFSLVDAGGGGPQIILLMKSKPARMNE
jgi:hypothetical protein